MIARQELLEISGHYPDVVVYLFNVMPNHIHVILILGDVNTHILSNIIGNYKSGISRKIRKLFPDMEVWQHSFYDVIIRSQAAYEKIWNYVRYNAEKWADDEYNSGC